MEKYILDNQNNRWRVYFLGQILTDFNLETVKKDCMQVLGFSISEVEKIFSGEKVILAGDLNIQDLEKYFNYFRELGLNVFLEEESQGIEEIVSDDFSRNNRFDIEFEKSKSKYINDHITQENYLWKISQNKKEVPKYFGLDLSARMDAVSFLNASLLMGIIFYIIFYATNIHPFLYELNELLPFAIFAPFFVYTLFYFFRITLLRTHDINYDPQFIIVFFIISLFLIGLSLCYLFNTFHNHLLIELFKIFYIYCFPPCLIIAVFCYLFYIITPSEKKHNQYGYQVIRGNIFTSAVLITMIVITLFYLL